jgi:hypothetical protein
MGSRARLETRQPAIGRNEQMPMTGMPRDLEYVRTQSRGCHRNSNSDDNLSSPPGAVPDAARRRFWETAEAGKQCWLVRTPTGWKPLLLCFPEAQRPPKVRLSHSEIEHENDDESENDDRTYQIPITFHQRPPITSQMTRLMRPVSAPNFHHVPSST